MEAEAALPSIAKSLSMGRSQSHTSRKRVQRLIADQVRSRLREEYKQGQKQQGKWR